MKIFYGLVITMALASYSFASGFLEKTTITPENCSEFLQIFLGEQDQPAYEFSLAIEPGKDIYNKGQKIPTYYLRADGIPKGKKFQIANRNAMGKVTVVFEGEHLGEGKITRKNGRINTCETIVCGGFERGEPSQFLLLDSQNETTNAVFYLPYPVEPATMDDLMIRMHYVNINPEAYFFDVENLLPSEKFQMISTSEFGKVESDRIASKSGRAACLMLWTCDKEPNGEGSFEVRRANGTLAIKFSWLRERRTLPPPLVILTIGHAPTDKEIEYAKETYFHTPF